MISARWTFPLVCAAVLAAGAILYAGNVLLAHTAYDEGVYLRQAELLARGLRPYRDFVLLHPPVAIRFLGALISLGASVAAVKIVMLGIAGSVVLLAMILVRRLGAPIWASAAAGVFAAGNVHFWFFTKVIHLELLLAFLLLSSAAAFLLGKGRWSAAASGLLAALAVGTKLTAVFLLVPMALAVVMTSPRDRRRLLVAGAACAAALAVVLSDLRYPEARELVFSSQITRPLQDAGLRWSLVHGIFLQDPLFWMLSAGALGALAASRLPRFRKELLAPMTIVHGSAAAATAASVILPRYFHDYYIFFTIPFLAAGIALSAAALGEYPLVRRLTVAAVVISAAWFGVWVWGAPRPSVPPVVAALRGRGGTLFAENPMITRLAGREPCPGYYFIDPYSMGILGISADRVWDDMRRCDEVLIDRESVAAEVVVIPYEVRSRLRAEGELLYRDDRYTLYGLKLRPFAE